MKEVEFMRTHRMKIMPTICEAEVFCTVLYISDGACTPYWTMFQNGHEHVEKQEPYLPRNAVVSMRENVVNVDGNNFMNGKSDSQTM